MGKLQIDVLGASFKVQAEEDDAYLEKLLSYYKDITDAIRKGSGLVNPVQISILSGITLVDELYKEKQKNAALMKKMETSDSEAAENLALNMIEKLDEVLGNEEEVDFSISDLPESFSITDFTGSDDNV